MIDLIDTAHIVNPDDGAVNALYLAAASIQEATRMQQRFSGPELTHEEYHLIKQAADCIALLQHLYSVLNEQVSESPTDNAIEDRMLSDATRCSHDVHQLLAQAHADANGFFEAISQLTARRDPEAGIAYGDDPL